MTSVRIAPPNSVVLIEDSLGGDIPESMNQSLVASTDSCIAVGCRAEADGETEIIIDDYDRSDIGELIFDGVLRTDSQKLVVSTVLSAVLLEAQVPDTETRLRIWANDRREPDRILIGIKR
ncbi:MAG: hypothetical protein H5U22_15780 [Rhizobium sp.]|nr:hypothetical protein [Rhizobium sp.]